MAHDHHHHDEGSYYVEQLCTIGVCGALGGVAIVLWYREKLSFLHPSFRLPLLLGGIALLVLVTIRAIAVWTASAKRVAHDHHHDHNHDHGHDHGHHHHEHGAECHHDHPHHHHHDHEHEHAISATPMSAGGMTVGHTHTHGDHNHGHDHSHGWGPWRYAVLLFPIMLFFLNLPNEGFAYVPLKDLSTADLGSLRAVEDKGTLGHELTFKELDGVAYNPDRRAAYEGKTVDLKGQFVGTNERVFRLVRLKINCCAADAIPLNAVIIVEPKDPNSKEKLPSESLQMKWVRVTGQIQFQSRQQQGGKEEWMTLIIVRPDEQKPLKDLVVEIPPSERPAAYEY